MLRERNSNHFSVLGAILGAFSWLWMSYSFPAMLAQLEGTDLALAWFAGLVLSGLAAGVGVRQLEPR